MPPLKRDREDLLLLEVFVLIGQRSRGVEAVDQQSNKDNQQERSRPSLSDGLLKRPGNVHVQERRRGYIQEEEKRRNKTDRVANNCRNVMLLIG